MGRKPPEPRRGRFELVTESIDPGDIRVQLFTVSDTRNPEDDESGSRMKAFVEDSDFQLAGHRILREDPSRLRENFREVLGDPGIDVVISSGGTGIAPRDRTLETVRPMLEVELPGFGELFRFLSYDDVGAYTIMSRATAGSGQNTVVVLLPGSPAAVSLAFEEIILPVLHHMVREILT